MTSSGEILEIQEEDRIENLIKKVLVYFCGFWTVLLFPITFFKAVRFVEKYEEAVIKRFGEVRQNRPIQVSRTKISQFNLSISDWLLLSYPLYRFI